MTDYRQVGEQLGAYIDSNNPSISQIKALLADLLAADELLGPMQDAASLPGFSRIQDHASSGNGEIHKIAVLQSLSRKYLPSILSSVEELLDGVLLVPKSRERRPKTLRENCVLNAARALAKLPRLGKYQRPGSKVQADANTRRNLFSPNRSAWPSLIISVAASVWLLSQSSLFQIITGNHSPDKAEYEDFHYGAEWLVGKIIKQKFWVRDALEAGDIDDYYEPGIWESLPSNAIFVDNKSFFGTLDYGFATYRIRDEYYIVFSLATQSDGFTAELVLDAIKIPWGYYMTSATPIEPAPCTIRGEAYQELYPVLDEAEVNRFMAEARSKLRDGELPTEFGPTVTIDKPRHLYRFNISRKKIEKVDGSRASCTGVLNDIAEVVRRANPIH